MFMVDEGGKEKGDGRVTSAHRGGKGRGRIGEDGRSGEMKGEGE